MANGVLPDDVVLAMLLAHDSRCGVRAVARSWRSVVDSNFQVRHFEPPAGRRFSVDFEVDRSMCKDTYCARFDAAGDVGSRSIEGTVAYLNWAPVYYRSARNERRDRRHALSERDTCALWRLIAGLLDQQKSGAGLASCNHGTSVPRDAGCRGHLVVTEGGGAEGCCVERHVVGRLSPVATQLVLDLLDHRRNSRAELVADEVRKNEW